MPTKHHFQRAGGAPQTPVCKQAHKTSEMSYLQDNRHSSGKGTHLQMTKYRALVLSAEKLIPPRDLAGISQVYRRSRDLSTPGSRYSPAHLSCCAADTCHVALSSPHAQCCHSLCLPCCSMRKALPAASREHTHAPCCCSFPVALCHPSSTHTQLLVGTWDCPISIT